MRKIITYIVVASVFAGLLYSCKKEGQLVHSASYETPIFLSAPTLDSCTKGIDPLQDLNLINFGLSAVWNFDENGEDDVDYENRWFLSNQAIIKTGSAETPWAINPTAYWPLFGDLCFFFHAPSNLNFPEIKFIETTTGYPQIEFTPSTTDIAGQIDFCMGVPVMHATRVNNPVPVTFNHALTQIMFDVNYTGIIPQGYFMLINELRIKNVVGTKKVSYTSTAPYFEWEDESGHTADCSYILERVRNHIRMDSIRRSTGVIPDTYQPLSNSPGRLYLIPQTLGPDATLEVIYGFYYNYGANPSLVAMFAKEISLNGQVWPGGKTVNYKLTVDVGISSPIKLESAILEWVPSGNTHPQYEFE